MIDSLFLNSPQFECPTLNAALRAEVTLKLETANPIRSFKGRGACLYMAKAVAGREIVCASAGNFGQALAYVARGHSIALTIYAAHQANPAKLQAMRALGAQVILAGDDFDAARTAAREAAGRSGARLVVDSLDIETVEGAGTIGLELLRLPRALDVLLIALGNGALCNGVATVMKALSPTTRIIAVAARGAPAMVESWRAGHVIAYPTVDTIADGLATRTPIPTALRDLQGLIDDALLVDDHTLIQAMRLLHESAGLLAEPSAAAGIAAIIANPALFQGQRVGTIICGSNLTLAQQHTWLGQENAP